MEAQKRGSRSLNRSHRLTYERRGIFEGIRQEDRCGALYWNGGWWLWTISCIHSASAITVPACLPNPVTFVLSKVTYHAPLTALFSSYWITCFIVLIRALFIHLIRLPVAPSRNFKTLQNYHFLKITIKFIIII